jgi:hypothetical protein
MRERISRHSGQAALVISIVALVGSSTGLANAARHAVAGAIAGHQISAKPHAGGILLLSKNKKFPAAAIPTAKKSSRAVRARR